MLISYGITRDVSGAGQVGDPPHPRPSGAGMGLGLMGGGAGMGIKIIPTMGMGMGMDFRLSPPHRTRPIPVIYDIMLTLFVLL